MALYKFNVAIIGDEFPLLRDLREMVSSNLICHHQQDHLSMETDDSVSWTVEHADYSINNSNTEGLLRYCTEIV